MDPVERADECTVRRIAADGKLETEVYSLVRYGSFERGDFVPGLSDLDYFLVVEEEEAVADDVETILRECTRSIEYREIDLAWEFRRNLADPYEGVPYKFLTIYQEDFRRHHSVVYGADILPEVPDYEFWEQLPARLARIERLTAEAGDDVRSLRFLAGEVARLLARFGGGDSLRKDDVLAALDEDDRTEAYRIYEAYVEGRDDEFDPERLRQFVVDTVDAIRTELRDSTDRRPG